jgi:chemotaxis protein histidine kinase CheA
MFHAETSAGSRVVTGTTLLGDGRVALILDIPAVLREVTQRTLRGPSARAGES